MSGFSFKVVGLRSRSQQQKSSRAGVCAPFGHSSSSFPVSMLTCLMSHLSHVLCFTISPDNPINHYRNWR